MKPMEFKCMNLLKECLTVGATKDFLEQIKETAESELQYQHEIRLSKLENDVKLTKHELDLI